MCRSKQQKVIQQPHNDTNILHRIPIEGKTTVRTISLYEKIIIEFWALGQGSKLLFIWNFKLSRTTLEKDTKDLQNIEDHFFRERCKGMAKN